MGSCGIRSVLLSHCSSRSTADESIRKSGNLKKPPSSPFLSFCTPLLLPSFSILLSDFPHFTRWSSRDGSVKTSLKEEVGVVHLWWELSPQINCVNHPWLLGFNVINSYIQLSITTAGWFSQCVSRWVVLTMRSTLGLLLGTTPYGDHFNLYQAVALFLVNWL